MSRLVHRLIEIHSFCDGVPDCFQDGITRHKINTVVDYWVEMGNWWEGEGPRTLLRVSTEDQELYDIECVQEQWFIYRVWD